MEEGKIHDVTTMDDEWVTRMVDGHEILVQRFHRVCIESSGITAKVFLDGQQVKGLQSVDLSHSIDGLPIVTLSILCFNVNQCEDQ